MAQFFELMRWWVEAICLLCPLTQTTVTDNGTVMRSRLDSCTTSPKIAFVTLGYGNERLLLRPRDSTPAFPVVVLSGSALALA